ncbi:SERTA domain-containing protein 3 [Stigmatopora nigra]
MIMKTQKRKLQPEPPSEEPPCGAGGGGAVVAWEKQREFVFSVSLRKYRRDQEMPEPSLRRSVLISNTLRQVEACLASPSAPPPEENQSPAPAKQQRVAEAEDWASLSTEPDFGVAPAVSSILGGLEPEPRAALRSLENIRSHPEPNAPRPKQHVRGVAGQDLMEWEAGVEAARSSYLRDVTAEDMFQDIDTSQLEAEVAVLGLRGEESPCRGAKGLPSFSSFSSPTSSLKDGLDLEHLVTMLAES